MKGINKQTQKKILSILLLVVLIVAIVFVLKEAGIIKCGKDAPQTQDLPVASPLNIDPTAGTSENASPKPHQETLEFSFEDVPETDGVTPYAEINNNYPYFTDVDLTRTDAFEIYSDLDELGRCGVAYANICVELMPIEKRGDIGSVKPSGWIQKKYDKDLVDGGYVWNRCHLIGFQLAGENANKLNLITGSRYMNVTGMLVFEDQVADYVKDEPGNHVLYRVTPVFVDDELVARGVLIEAYSVEDEGDLCFCVFCYNIQPGIVIDYATGETWEDPEWEDD